MNEKRKGDYTLLGFGDICLQGPLATQGPAADAMRRALAGATHQFGNLEQALTERGESAEKLVCLRGHPDLAHDLRSFGLDIVTCANNHTMDFGTTGMRDTLAACEAAGLANVGLGETLSDSLAPAILEADGWRIAFIGVSTSTAENAGAGADRPGIAPIRVFTRFLVDTSVLNEAPGASPFIETTVMPGDTERVAEIIRRARETADLVVVGLHWGVPFGWGASAQHEISGYQSPLAHALIDAGADAILGHHPHYLQGVELYRGKPVFYSLGNFLWHRVNTKRTVNRPYPVYSWGGEARKSLSRYSGFARLTWTSPTGDPAVRFVPAYINDHGEPVLPDEAQTKFILERLTEGSQIFGTTFEKIQEDGIEAFRIGAPG